MLHRLIRFALEQRLLILVFTLLLIVIGLWTYRELPVDAFPDISTTQVQVIVKAPGMGPLDVEQRITYPIETAVRGIPRQTVLRSITKYALAVITIDFAERTDIYWARQQVSERISQILAQLPEGVEGDLAPITMPLSDIYMFLVEGEGYSNMELRGILDWYIRPRLLSVAGVADVNALGGEVRSFHVVPRPNKLQAYGLTIDDVSRAVAANNRNAGGDRFVRNNEVLLVRSIGQIETAEDLRAITITTRDSIPIHVGDVAMVEVGALTRYGGITRHGQGEGVQGLVLNRRGANSRLTVEEVKVVLADLAPTLPEGVRIEPFYDRTDLVNRAVSTVENALLQAVVLVLIVLIVFLGNWRSALTVGTILPLTVLGTFIPMYLTGISANLMSLGGIAIAIGILVDSAVVMVENVQSQLGRSSDVSRREAVLSAASEVAKPIFSGVLIIVVSFLPIFSLTGIEGKLFGPLAFTIVFALLTSLILSLTVIPVLASLLIGDHKDVKETVLQRILLYIYRPSVRWAVNNPRLSLGGAVVLLVLTLALVPFIGKEFLPYLDEGTIVLQVEKLPSISLQESMNVDTQIEQALMTLPEITGVVSRVGSDELRLDPMGLNESDIFLIARPREEWTDPDPMVLQEKMRVILDSFPGINYGFTQPIDMRVSEMLTGVRSAVAIKLLGDDLDILDQKAQQIEKILTEIPGSIDIFRSALKGQVYLSLSMRYGAMSRYGVTVEDINNLVTTAIGGQVVTEVIQGNQRIPILVRYPETFRNSARAISDLLIDTPSGAKVHLGDLTEIQEEDGPVQIQREGGKRQVVIQANVQGRDVVSFVEDVRASLSSNLELPPGYFTTFGGQFENQQRAAKRLALVVPVALFIIFMVLFMTFGSVRQAAIILMNIPLAMIGGVVLLFLTGLYLSVPASVGFIALLGLAVMNGVVMVNYFNQLREEGLTLREAVLQGSERRMRPVLMTALLTVLGLLPLLLATGPGSEIQRPLAVVVVGGTFTSTALTLILLPSLYLAVEGWFARRSDVAKSVQ